MNEATTTEEPETGSVPSDKAATGPTRVLLVRHAVTPETGPKLTGRAPGVDLSEQGRGQAAALARRLAAIPIVAVYASPIERTTQTALEIAEVHRLDVNSMNDLIEADYGDWTGAKISELSSTPEWKVVQNQPSRAAFPGGETIRSMQARVVSGIDSLVAEHPGETITVVSHADPIKSAIAHYSGIHLDLFQRIHVSPASVTVLEFHSLSTMLVKLNDTGSLDELAHLPPQNETAKS